jgi:DnaJ homolog subfamily C member 7
MASEAEEFKLKGNSAFKAQDYSSAIAFYSESIRLNPSESNYFSNRGLCYLRLKRYKDCLNDCQKALSQNPDNAKALLHAAKCYIVYGDLNQAFDHLHKGVQLRPGDFEILETLQLLESIRDSMAKYREAMEKEQFSQALYFLGQVEEHTHEQPEIMIKRLEILVLSGKSDEALSMASMMLRSYANNPEFLVLKGRLHYYTGAIEVSKKHFMEALRLDPDFQPAKVMMRKLRDTEKLKEEANKLFLAGDNDGAIDAYGRLLLEDPANKSFNATILANRAAAYMKKSDFVTALTDINEAIRTNPDYTKAYMRRGNIYTHLGKFTEAYADYESVRQKEPNYPELDNSIRLTKLEEKKSKRKNYYLILGVDKNATSNEIKKAYKKSALLNHPDKNSETEEKRLIAEQKFKDIGEAYTILSNPEKKQRYDNGEDISEIEGGAGGMHDPSEVFRMFFGGGGGGGGGGGFKTSFRFG